MLMGRLGGVVWRRDPVTDGLQVAATIVGGRVVRFSFGG